MEPICLCIHSKIFISIVGVWVAVLQKEKLVLMQRRYSCKCLLNQIYMLYLLMFYMLHLVIIYR